MVWEYYKRLAEAVGIKDDKERPYSIYWFYEHNEPENLNTITRAFLGDQNALDEISCISDAEAEADINHIREFCTDKINVPQLKAIAHAIRDDVCIIQGPPGTGKTQTIGNLLRCLMSREDRPSVAVVSSNGEAIRNIVDLIKEDDILCDCFALLGKTDNRKQFYESHRDAVWAADFSKENKYRFDAGLLQDFPIVFSTIHSLWKCFVLDENFRGIFDYVIVDECSQVGNMLGLLAMAAARRLVLLGDDMQLSPIFVDVADDVAHPEGIESYYLDKGDNSFMKAVAERFEGHIGKGFLSMHYRCHPAIIGYCNEYVYDGQLEICSDDDGKLPIRVRWYEGDYWEEIIENGRKENQNLKQISIFMREEYPTILAKLRENEDFSVCVLSPYRYPLEQLKRELIAYNERTDENLEAPEIEDDGFDPVEKIPQLTIHKAQGRGYDLVVFLTIKDCGSNIWAQRRAIVNVAVSRAKKELLIIASSIWMTPDMQEELLGYSVNSGAEQEKLYLRYMMEYVREQELHRHADGYGLQHSSMHSVFDRIPYYREKEKRNNGVTGYKAGNGVRASAPELCMINALYDNDYIREKYKIYREVPLKAFDAIHTEDEACRKYIEDGARFDIVLIQDKKVCAIIEVDGAYHRTDEEQKNNDVMKDAAVISLGAVFAERRFFRFSTDGTSRNEVEKVVEALQTETDNLPEVETEGLLKQNYMEDSMREDLVNMLNDVICGAIQRIIDELESGDPGRIDHVREKMDHLSYVRGNAPAPEDYADPIFCDLYLMRFGYAYAFEYSVIYDAIIRRYTAGEQARNGRPVLGVSSLACGTMIDAWGLAYALACIRENGELNLPEDLELSYHGEDLTRWSYLFACNQDGDQALNDCFNHRPSANDFETDAAEYIRRDRNYHWLNVMTFAKFLGELPEEIVVNIEEAIREAIERGDFVGNNNNNRQEYFICISHSASTVDNAADDRHLSELASRIIHALNINNDFDVDAHVMDISPYCNRQDVYDNEVGIICNNEEIPMYKFASRPSNYQGVYGAKISDLNPDFRNEEADNLEARLYELFAQNRISNRQPIKRAHYLRFQVIKLTRR